MIFHRLRCNLLRPCLFFQGVRRTHYLVTALTVLGLWWCTSAVRANDGMYYASGNHLIPMLEPDISVQKEVLSMQIVGDDKVKVVVQYEFFNPKASKTLDVGFEALPPTGDVDGTPVKGQHPYISEFTVTMNGQALPYSVAIVSDTAYYQQGAVRGLPLDKALKVIENVNGVPFMYAYHFKAPFQAGRNTITHTYYFTISASVDMLYYIPYVLTAATRWANRRIDDFTLTIDVGRFTDFYIPQTFFKGAEAWEIQGVGKKALVPANAKGVHEQTRNSVHFWMREGAITFRAKNFAPTNEFTLFGMHHAMKPPFRESAALPLWIGAIESHLFTAHNETALKILRNLPFARRGMVFKTPEIQRYYQTMAWYIPDTTYQANVQALTNTEQEWLRKLQVPKK